MSKNKEINDDSSLETVESALTKTEQFIEDNQKSVTLVTVALLIVVSLYLAFTKLYIAPKEKEAQSVMFVAEQYFQKDSFNLALNGDGNNWGFLDIISDYKMTKSAKLANYYAGICYLSLGEYDEAISHLKKYKSNDYMVGTIALGAIGDAYTELGEYKKAISFYEKAANKNPNEFTSPIYLSKAALLYENEGDYKKALEAYKSIKKKYPKSQEGRNIDKMISKAKIASEQK